MARVQQLLPHVHVPDSVQLLRSYIAQELQNITEPGEQAQAQRLLELTQRPLPWNQKEIVAASVAVAQLNITAIEQKDQEHKEASERTIKILSVVATITLIVLLSFLINFPASILNPITEVTKRLQNIADGNYKQTVPVTDDYEIGKMAQAFNLMVAELDKFRRSSLAEVIFEKTRYETLFQSLRDPFIILNDAAQVVSANRNAQLAYFTQGASTIGKSIQDLQDASPLLYQHWVMLENNTWNPNLIWDVVIQKSIKHYVPAGMVVTGLDARDNTTKIMGYVLQLRDITEVKDLEMAKSEFLALISHELKTPLSAVNLSLTLLDREKDPTQVQQLHEHIAVENTRMLKLVNDVLAMSRLEAEQVLEASDHIVLQEFLSDVLKQYAQIVSGRKLEVVFELEAQDCQAPPKALHLAVSNLLSNALKYSVEGSTVVLRVNSIGNETKFSLVNAVAQVGSYPAGTGLGLRMVNQLAQRFGWQFSWLISQDGKEAKASLII